MPVFGGAPQCQRCNKSVYMAEQVIGPGGAYHRMCLTCKECNKLLDSTTLTERQNEAYCKVCYNRKWGPKGYGFASGAAFLSTETKTPKEILEEQGQYSPKVPARPASPPREEESSGSMSSFWSSKQVIPGTKPAIPGNKPVASKPLVPSNKPAFTSAKPAVPTNKPVSVPTKPPLPSRPNQQAPQMPPRPTHVSSPAPAIPATKPAYLNTGYVPRKVNVMVQNDTCTKCGKAVYAAELAMGAGNKYHKFCLKCTECGKLLNSTNMADKDFDLYCRGCYAKLYGPKGFGYGNLLTTEGSTR